MCELSGGKRQRGIGRLKSEWELAQKETTGGPQVDGSIFPFTNGFLGYHTPLAFTCFLFFFRFAAV